MAEEKRERFGRYLILDHLVDGGMAKICRARFLGQEADKVVAIKMVQPQFSQDEAFKRMFMDEIKVVFGLLHPNIVQTYDYGFQKKQLFVAMEYCDGRNLQEYLNRLRKKKFVFPVEVSVYIISQACQGLHYAHTYTDKLTGKTANIIHRDISPHNIMMTYDGAIKVIDFGIAKSDKSEDKTQAGTIKGKIGYLAPEYIEGMELDHRYDQFALGITLWEMLCARKLFKGPSDFAILKKIQECEIPPPSSINPKVPKELDEIVLTALNPDRTKRHKNLDQLNRLLIKFLYSNYPDFNSSDLAYFAKGLFKEEIKTDREKLFEYGKIDIAPYLKDLKREMEGIKEEEATRTRKKEQVIDFGLEENEETSTIGLDRNKKKKFDQRKIDLSVVLERRHASTKIYVDKNEQQNMSAVTSVQGMELEVPTPFSSGDKKRMSPAHNAPPPLPSKKREEEAEKKRNSRKEWIFAVGTAVAAMAFLYKDEIPQNFCKISRQTGISVCAKKIIVKKEDSLEAEIKEDNLALEEPSAQKDYVYLILRNFDKRSMTVYLDGVKKSTDILGRIQIPVDKVQTLRIESPRSKHFIKSIDSSEGEDVQIFIPEREREFFGHLYSSSDCGMAGTISFETYGEKRTERLPIQSRLGIAFPIQERGPASTRKATHTLVYQPDQKNYKKKLFLKFNKDGQRVNICSLDSSDSEN